MTRTTEKGENEITAEAKRQAERKGQHVCAVLDEMLRAAQKNGDRVKQMKIVQAQKFLRCRNQRKRGRQQ